MARWLWRSAVGFTGLVGLLGAGLLWSPSTLVGAFVAVTVFATVICWCAQDQPDGGSAGPWHPARRSLLYGVRVAAVVVAVSGLCTIVGPAGLGLVLLLFLTSPPVLDRVRLLLRGRREVGRAYRGTVEDAERVRRMSTRQLCEAWTTSCYQLRHATSPEAGMRLVRLRHLYLDELERRDPVGFQAWLGSTASAAGDPSRFLTS